MLSIRDLVISLNTGDEPLELVRGVSFDIAKGEILGVVGESGCGKSLTSLAIMGLLSKPMIYVSAGEILFLGQDITHLEPHERVDKDCAGVSMIFQEPMTSLNPVMRVGDQIQEALSIHDRSGSDPQNRARELLDLVQMPDARAQLGAYPHELSGGMRQRVMIAIALACNPRVLIADEPTTALDVTVQSQILALIRQLCGELDMAVLFITHDLGVVAQLADRVAVMYAGQLAEVASVTDLFERRAHPYTDGLFNCLTDPDNHGRRLTPIVGQAPLAHEIGDGCAFAPRCGFATEACMRGDIAWESLGTGHRVRCLHAQIKAVPA